MDIIQKHDEKYLKQGMNSIKEYKLNELEKDIDEIIVSQRDKLNFKGTAKNFKKNALKFVGIHLSGKKAVFNFLNKNEYIVETVKVIESYLSQNPALVEIGFNTIESELGISMKDLGFERDSYKQILKAFQKKGFVGKGSGLDIIVDKLMNNTENVAAAVSTILSDKKIEKMDVDEINEFISSTGITAKGIQEAYKKGNFKGRKGVFNYATNKIMENLEDISALILDEISEEEIRGISINQVGKIVSSDLGITIKGIQKVYKENGLNGEKGVIKYLSDSLIINGIKKIYKDILPAEFGKDKGFTSKDMIGAYKKDGIVGRNGLVNKAVGLAFWQVPFLDQLLYSQILNLIKNDKIKQEIRMREAESSIGIDFQEGIDNLTALENKFRELSAIPKEMSQDKLEEVYNNYGVFGNKGLISYLSENIPLIFENAKNAGVLDEGEVSYMSMAVQNFGLLKSPENIKLGSRSKDDMFAINIAKKSEEMQIDTKELLSNPDYIGVRKDIIKQAYGSIEKYEEKYEFYVFLKKRVECLFEKDKDIKDIKNKLNAGNAKDVIMEEVQSFRPDGFLGVIFDKLAEKYIKKTVGKKAADYFNLTKALIEQQLEKDKKEIQAYKAVKD